MLPITATAHATAVPHVSQMVADLSAANPPATALRAAGYTGVIRYAAQGRTDVNIKPAQVHDYLSHGLAVGIVNEHTADYMMSWNGYDCAEQAQAISVAAGLPEGVVYSAADFDLTNGGFIRPGSLGEHHVDLAAAFLQKAGAAIGVKNVGFYGSYFACIALATRLPWLKWYWQTEAWSGGFFFQPAVLYQYASNGIVPGVDRDAAVLGFWGQRVTTAKKLSDMMLVLPLLSLGSSGNDVKLLQEGMVRGSGAKIAVDGVYGPATMAAVTQTQKLWRLLVDGIAGPQTDRVISHELVLKGL